jgi:hypothetical protein
VATATLAVHSSVEVGASCAAVRGLTVSRAGRVLLAHSADKVVRAPGVLTP